MVANSVPSGYADSGASRHIRNKSEDHPSLRLATRSGCRAEYQVELGSAGLGAAGGIEVDVVPLDVGTQ
jgi:hypothetical protein